MFKLQNNTTVFYEKEFSTAGEKLIEYLSLFYGISAEFQENADISIVKKEMKDEHYELNVGEKTVIAASGIRGAIYGISTFLQSIDRETLSVSDINLCDSPYKEFRGMHTFLPARKDIGMYKRFLEAMAFFKMNTIIIEVGGGMEYEKHPEINEAWERFCTFCQEEFPGNVFEGCLGKSRSVQYYAQVYWKDSIHTELAGGSFLTKEEVRGIVDHAKSLGLDVIPEIQGLSHCYYLTLTHREIAEKEDDLFPDSYCPMNEESYKLYFEVAEEVLEVFKPKSVSIGHDEVRVLGVCDKCKDKTGHELFAYEVNRLTEFYEKKGINVFMWGEMVLHMTTYAGKVLGEEWTFENDYGFTHTYPEAYEAKDMISKNITMLDWYYLFDHATEAYYKNEGFRSAFGNFIGSKLLNWQERSKDDNLIGAEVSTWIYPDEEHFTRDGIFFEMAFSGNMLWEKDYSESKYVEMTEKVIRQLNFTRALIRGEMSRLFLGKETEVIYTGEKERAFTKIDLSKAREVSPAAKKAADQFGTTVYGISADAENLLLNKEFYAESLVFLHTAKKDMPFSSADNFLNYRPYGIGAYVLLYEDGTYEIINADFGKTIGNMNLKIEAGDGSIEANDTTVDMNLYKEDKEMKAPTFAPNSQWYSGVMYETVPLSDDETTAFVYEWRNPHPEKKIIKLRVMNTCRDVEQSVVLFGISAIH